MKDGWKVGAEKLSDFEEKLIYKVWKFFKKYFEMLEKDFFL